MLHNLSRQIKIIIKIFFLEIYTNLKHTYTLNYLIKKKETIARYELHVHQNIQSWSYMYIKIFNPGVTCTSKYAILESHVHHSMQSWSYMYIKIFNPVCLIITDRAEENLNKYGTNKTPTPSINTPTLIVVYYII